jgi:hypothetical protein
MRDNPVSFHCDYHGCRLDVARRSPDRPPSPLVQCRGIATVRVEYGLHTVHYSTYSTNVFILRSPIHARGTRSDRSLLQAPIRKKLGRARAATEQLGGASQDLALPVLYRESFRTDCAPLCPHGGGLAGEGDAGEAIPCVRNCTVTAGTISSERLEGIYKDTVDTVWFSPSSTGEDILS